MSRFLVRTVVAFLCMACFLSCSDMIGWVEFHHNADIKSIEASTGNMRTQSDGDTAYTLGLLPTESMASLRVTPENPDATISIRVDSGEFVDLPAGTYSGNVAPTMISGEYMAEIRVTSPSGKTVKTYAVRVIRGEVVRVNRFGVWGYRDHAADGTVRLRITSADESVTFVSASIPATAFPLWTPGNGDWMEASGWVYFSFPETELYRGIEYRIGLYHDQDAVTSVYSDICIPFKNGKGMFYDLRHDDASIAYYLDSLDQQWGIGPGEWLNPIIDAFVIP